MQRYLSATTCLLTSICCFGLLISCGEPAEPVMMRDGGKYHALLDAKACEENEYAETGLVRSHLGPFTHMCSGTLIAPDIVLTAGHCVNNDAPLTFTPAARPRSSFDSSPVAVARAVVHPRLDLTSITRLPLAFRILDPYNEGEANTVRLFREACGELLLPGATNIFQVVDVLDLASCLAQLPEALHTGLQISSDSQEVNDIAILFLEKPLPHLTTAALPSSSSCLAGVREATLVGYGESSRSWWSWLTNQAFGKRFAGQTMVHRVGKRELMLLPGPARARPGDSGGPLFLHTPEGHVIAGIASRVDLSNDTSSLFIGLAFYTRVDAYLDWITSEIKVHRAGLGQ